MAGKNIKLIGFVTNNEEFADAIKEKANLEHRSVSSYLKHLICKELQYKGEL